MIETISFSSPAPLGPFGDYFCGASLTINTRVWRRITVNSPPFLDREKVLWAVSDHEGPSAG